MANLHRRRSRSQTPNRRNQIINKNSDKDDFDLQRLRREILRNKPAPGCGNGVRLVSTRRPITPIDTRRQLYGKVAPADRPPSAFSLKYLQNEKRNPLQLTLEPLERTTTDDKNDFSDERINSISRKIISRSQSLDSCCQNYFVKSAGGGKKFPKKLPSLNISGVSMRSKNIESIDGKPSSADDNDLKEEIRMMMTTKKSSLSRSFHLLAQSSTEKLIEMLKEHAGLKDCTEETVQHINTILVELYERVRYGDKNWKRGLVLGGLYGLVECSSAKILCSVARVVLATNVTGSNLTGACKLIFKVARNEQNDDLFFENDILELLIDGLGRASPLDDPEACIYGYGSIRFLTSSTGASGEDCNKNFNDYFDDYQRKPSTAPPVSLKYQQDFVRPHEKLSKQYFMVERLTRHGAIELMILHLQMINEAGMAKKLKGPPLHSLYQLSAALRALANVQQFATFSNFHSRKQTDNDNDGADFKIHLELACPHLIKATEVTIGEIEVQENIVRTLSALSDDDECCRILANSAARIGMILGSCCEIYSQSPEKLLSLLNRLGYILGNLMAKYDSARVQFYQNDVAMEYLLNVLEIYSKENFTLHNQMGDTVIDVLVKMIRVIANMSVNPEVGFGLGATKLLGEILLSLLSKTSDKLMNEMLELIQASLGAMHNLCFYQDKSQSSMEVGQHDSKGCLNSVLNQLAITLCTILWSSSEAVQIETTRVLGNLTRNQYARESFCKSGGLRAIIHCISSDATGSYDLKTSAVGVLVNLLGDYENRTPFVEFGGDLIIVNLLRSAIKQEDWFLSAVICQALWNLISDIPNDSRTFANDNVLFNDVAVLLDHCLADCEVDSADVAWQEFNMVGSDLLQQIKCFDDDISPAAASEEEQSDDEIVCRQ